MSDAYVIEIEIDADSGTIVLTKSDGYVSRVYTVEELEGKGAIDNALAGGATLTVYSQGEQYTLEEYQELFGEENIEETVNDNKE